MYPWEKEKLIEDTQKNTESSRARSRLWRNRHPEANSIGCKEFRAKNPDCQRKWRAANPDKVKQYSMDQNDTEHRREYMREYMRKRRAAEKAKQESEGNSAK